MEKSVTEGELFCGNEALQSSRQNSLPEVTDFSILTECLTQDTFSCILFTAHNICVYLYNQNLFSHSEMLTLIKIIF
jgi:hypothetical protein